MRRWTPLVALVGLMVASVAAVVIARRTRPEFIVAEAGQIGRASDLPVLAGAAPPITATGWLNTPPLSASDLAGKVVLYDFWTFACINCKHTLPSVKAWYARYARDGLVVIGVHTPEFDFEADPSDVAAFVTAENIHFPVALDPLRATWDAFANHYWPAFYLHDREGRRRLEHFGEGSYRQTEDAIRVLLGVDPTSPRATVSTP